MVFFMDSDVSMFYLTTLTLPGPYSVDGRVVNKCTATGRMRLGKGNRSTRRKAGPVSLWPPQIPYDLTSSTGRRGRKPATNGLSYVTAVKLYSIDDW
jgi:hypothetical protein